MSNTGSGTGIVISSSTEVFAAPRRRGQPLRTLASGCLVAVAERAPRWLTVTLPPEGDEATNDAGGAIGYVDAACVALVDPDGRGHLAADAVLQHAEVEPAAGERLVAGVGRYEGAVARAWNLYGGLLSELSHRLGIDPAYAVAVLCVESGGQGYGPDGRVIIRFENHIMRRYLPAARQSEFDSYFRATGDQPWLGHTFRESTSQPWTAFHGSQALEWRAYGVACAIDADAASRSISMGLPQVMGFNHALVGYPTPQAMLAFMGADVRFQLLALFDFVAGAKGQGPALAALRRDDFDGFATLYNGPGQARYYGDLIHAHVQAFHALKPAPKRPKTTPSTSTSTSSTAASVVVSGRRYEVRPGDTLGAIAGRFGVTLAEVVAANQIADPNRIYVGQVLTIPDGEPSPPPVVVPSAPPEDIADDGEPAEGHVYVVRPGDTLGVIAQRAGTTVAALAAANGISNPNLIYPGQVIRTPSPVA